MNIFYFQALKTHMSQKILSQRFQLKRAQHESCEICNNKEYRIFKKKAQRIFQFRKHPLQQRSQRQHLNQVYLINNLKSQLSHTNYDSAVYLHLQDVSYESKSELRSFKDYLSKSQCQQIQLFAYDLVKKTYATLKAKIKLTKAQQPLHYFYQVKFTGKSQNQQLRQITRIIKVPYWVKMISINQLRDHSKLSLCEIGQKYCLLGQELQYQAFNFQFSYQHIQIINIQIQSLKPQTSIISMTFNPQIQSQKYMYFINQTSQEYIPQKDVKIQILLNRNDVHFKIRLCLPSQQYQNKTIGDAKQIIKVFLLKQIAFLIHDSLDSYQLKQLSDQESQLQNNQMFNKLLKNNTKIFRFFPPKFQNQITLTTVNKQKKVFQYQVERTAFLQANQQILIKKYLSLKRIKIGQLRQDYKIMSNRVNFKKDTQCLIQIKGIFHHKFIYAQLIKISYQWEKKQIKTIHLHPNNVIIYANHQNPFNYSFCTANDLFNHFQKPSLLYIFDSRNDSFKVTNVEKLEMKQYQFYAIEPKSGAESNMIIVDGIRLLNTALLSEFHTIVNIQDQGKDKKTELYVEIYKEQINLIHHNNIFKGKQFYKIHEGNVYLNHMLPHLKFREQKRNIHKEYYKNQYQLIIDKANVQFIPQNIIYIKQSTKANKFSFNLQQKQMVTDLKYIRFIVRLNHYYDQNKDTVQLKQNSYYYVSQINQDFYLIIQLQKPSFQSQIHILWVDDHPQSNSTIIRQVQDEGRDLNLQIQFNQLISTQVTIAWIKLFYPYFKWMNPNCKIKLITDMKRDDHTQAGVELIDQIVGLGVDIQFSIYSGNYEETQKIINSHQSLRKIHVLLAVQRYQICKWCLQYPIISEAKRKLTQLKVI